MKQRRQSENRQRQRRGATLVEMALCVILFLTLLFGVINWGYIFYTEQSIASRAARAARVYAMQSELYYADLEAAKTAAEEIVRYGSTPCSGCSELTGLTGATVAIENPI